MGQWRKDEAVRWKESIPAGGRRFLNHRLAVAGALYLLLLVFCLTIIPFLSQHSPTALSEDQFAAPSAEHWFGTDVHGRDLFGRTVFGLRISIFVGVCGAAVSLVIGAVWGSCAAYFGGWLDAVLMRTVDVLYAMPSIIFVIVLMAGYDGIFLPYVERFLGLLMDDGVVEAASFVRLLLLYLGLGAVSWLTIARIVRGEVLALKERSFVLASRVLGASAGHILRRHILPNLYGVLAVYLTLAIPSIILYESFLSFLGLGIQPPFASVGSLISEGAQQINPIRIYWWMIFFPTGSLVSTLLAFHFVGNGLREVFNLRRSAGNS